MQVLVEVRASNTAALSLYKSLGLQPQGTEPEQGYYDTHSSHFIETWGQDVKQGIQGCAIKGLKRLKTGMEDDEDENGQDSLVHVKSGPHLKSHNQRGRRMAAKLDLAMWECCGLLELVRERCLFFFD